MIVRQKVLNFPKYASQELRCEPFALVLGWVFRASILFASPKNLRCKKFTLPTFILLKFNTQEKNKHWRNLLGKEANRVIIL